MQCSETVRLERGFAESCLKPEEGEKNHLELRRKSKRNEPVEVGAEWPCVRYKPREAVLRVTNCLCPLFCFHKEVKMLSPLTKQKENISNTSLSVDALVFTDCLYFYFS